MEDVSQSPDVAYQPRPVAKPLPQRHQDQKPEYSKVRE
jgi:hypothetical protein